MSAPLSFAPGEAYQFDRSTKSARPKLVPCAGRFDGFHAVPASVSKTCLVRFDCPVQQLSNAAIFNDSGRTEPSRQGCKRRSKNPSVKRPNDSVAPE
jgi:hypothetical protein